MRVKTGVQHPPETRWHRAIGTLGGYPRIQNRPGDAIVPEMPRCDIRSVTAGVRDGIDLVATIVSSRSALRSSP